jgi:SnoaL-like domain
MLPETLETWLAEYRRAWAERDADAAADLFTEDGVYASAPFRPPHVGRERIREYWRWEPARHESLDLRFGTPIIEGNRAAIEWWAIMRQDGELVTGPGCLVLRFDRAGRCEELREYWHEAAGAHPPPARWGK